jgi:hypothetical protein
MQQSSHSQSLQAVPHADHLRLHTSASNIITPFVFSHSKKLFAAAAAAVPNANQPDAMAIEAPIPKNHWQKIVTLPRPLPRPPQSVCGSPSACLVYMESKTRLLIAINRGFAIHVCTSLVYLSLFNRDIKHSFMNSIKQLMNTDV